mgnify:FL=1
MSIVNKILGLFLGNKYERDLKEISPYVEKVHIEFEKLQGLSNDELRDKTVEIKSRIKEYIREDEAEIVKLRDQAEKEGDVYKK